jgi:hypothetical protein
MAEDLPTPGAAGQQDGAPGIGFDRVNAIALVDRAGEGGGGFAVFQIDRGFDQRFRRTFGDFMPAQGARDAVDAVGGVAARVGAGGRGAPARWWWCRLTARRRRARRRRALPPRRRAHPPW